MGLFQGDAEPGPAHVMNWDENMELREREGCDKVTGQRQHEEIGAGLWHRDITWWI